MNNRQVRIEKLFNKSVTNSTGRVLESRWLGLYYIHPEHIESDRAAGLAEIGSIRCKQENDGPRAGNAVCQPTKMLLQGELHKITALVKQSKAAIR